MNRKYYTGIGSRTTPEHILRLFSKIADILEKEDYVLRSGGAEGADSAFESGVLYNANKHIYLPWHGFKNRYSYSCFIVPKYPSIEHGITAQELYIGNWRRLSVPIKKLMTRNVYQVLGQNNEPVSEFLICWTSDGCTCHVERTYKTGGTGQAISVADRFNVPVFNIQKRESFENFIQLLKDKFDIHEHSIDFLCKVYEQ